MPQEEKEKPDVLKRIHDQENKYMSYTNCIVATSPAVSPSCFSQLFLPAVSPLLFLPCCFSNLFNWKNVRFPRIPHPDDR